MKTLTTSVLALVIGAAGGVSTVLAQDAVELEVIATEPEYQAQDEAIWSIYEQENPNVDINVISINEDTEPAYQARVAAGDPADIRTNILFPTKDNYQTYVDVSDYDCVAWDKFTYDARDAFEQTHGIDYQPGVNVRNNPFRSFIYYEDVMRDAGLDPRSISSLEELDAFLADLKAYVDADPKLEHVIDAGWLPPAWGRFNMEVWAMGFGATKGEVRDLFLGRTEWTDEENNPLVPFFAKLKDWYEKGYMPENWWERSWEQEFEASFIAGRSAVAFHGPWLFDKVLAQNPTAELNGFFFPPNREGKVWGPEATSDYGSALYAANVDKPNFEEARKAFCWWVSPEIVKLRAEAIGFVPAMDLGEVGGADLINPQYLKVLKPVIDGEVSGVSFDNSLCAMCAAARYRVPGTPEVMQDNAAAGIFGDYLEGEMELSEVLAWFEDRWERAYDIPEGGVPR